VRCLIIKTRKEINLVFQNRVLTMGGIILSRTRRDPPLKWRLPPGEGCVAAVPIASGKAQAPLCQMRRQRECCVRWCVAQTKYLYFLFFRVLVVPASPYFFDHIHNASPPKNQPNTYNALKPHTDCFFYIYTRIIHAHFNCFGYLIYATD